MPSRPEQNSRGQAGETWAHPPPQEAGESGSLHGEPPLLFAPPSLSGCPSPSLFTPSGPVPVPSSVSGLLVVHINYTFLSVCSVILSGGVLSFIGEGEG